MIIISYIGYVIEVIVPCFRWNRKKKEKKKTLVKLIPTSKGSNDNPGKETL